MSLRCAYISHASKKKKNFKLKNTEHDIIHWSGHDIVYTSSKFKVDDILILFSIKTVLFIYFTYEGDDVKGIFVADLILLRVKHNVYFRVVSQRFFA